MTDFPTVSYLTNLHIAAINQKIAFFIETELSIIAKQLLDAAGCGKSELCREYDVMKYDESYIKVLVAALRDKKFKVSEPTRVDYTATASQDDETFWRIYISGW